MRFDGTLIKWDDSRGFGFIAAAQGGAEIFVHISAFARDGRRPSLGEKLSFEMEMTNDGKKRAVKVWRPDRTGARYAASSTPSAWRPRRKSKGTASTVIGVLLVAALAAYGYEQYARRVAAYRPTSPDRPAAAAPAPVAGPAQPNWRCDGRSYCSQMRSCAEAKFFLNNCPNTKMDGNHDGVPCEQQWCTGPAAQ
jgi:cold shock CspA family protein